MYAISEITLNNQQDCWSRLFIYIARSIMDTCGRTGESAIREAVRQYGAQRGTRLREANEKKGVNNNLATLQSTGCDLCVGPRTRQQVLTHTEEVFLWEVYTCPMASLWQELGESKLGSYYCEECTFGLVEAYTQNKGQANLSKLLTSGFDNHCRFSVYFRPANLDQEQNSRCFDKGKSSQPITQASDFAQDMADNWIHLYYYLLKNAVDKFGSEGACAVAQGLRKLAADLPPILLHHAQNTRLTEVTVEFLKENFPMNLDIDKDPRWEGYREYEAKEIMKSSFITPFQARLKLH